MTFTSSRPTTTVGDSGAFSAEKLAAMLAAQAPSTPDSTKRNTSVSGSEDFAYVSQQVPAVMLSLAAGHPDHGHQYALHHPAATFSDDVLPVGSAIHACVAMRWLEEHAQ